MIIADSAVEQPAAANSPAEAKVPWQRAHQAEVTLVVREMLEETERGTDRCRRTRNPQAEVEVSDPSFLSLAQSAERELLTSLEAFVVQFTKERGLSPPIEGRVSLLLPAKAPIVTCIKICLTRIPPSFDLLIPNATNWHDLRCKLGRWLWKVVSPALASRLATRLFGNESIQVNVIFNMSSSDARPVPLSGQTLFDIMWAVVGPACVALGEYCSSSHSAEDHASKQHSQFLLEEFFLKFLAQRVIFLVEKICLEKAEELLREEIEANDRKRRRTEEEERPKRRRLERREAGDNLRERLDSLKRSERLRLEGSELPDWRIPAMMDPTPAIPALLKWKPPEYVTSAANGFRLPPEATPASAQPMSEFDWEVVTSVLKYLRDRGINLLVSTDNDLQFFIGELINTSADPFEPTKAQKSIVRKNGRRKNRVAQESEVGQPDPHNHLYTMPEFKAFLTGHVAAFHEDEEVDGSEYEIGPHL